MYVDFAKRWKALEEFNIDVANAAGLIAVKMVVGMEFGMGIFIAFFMLVFMVLFLLFMVILVFFGQFRFNLGLLKPAAGFGRKNEKGETILQRHQGPRDSFLIGDGLSRMFKTNDVGTRRYQFDFHSPVFDRYVEAADAMFVGAVLTLGCMGDGSEHQKGGTAETE